MYDIITFPDVTSLSSIMTSELMAFHFAVPLVQKADYVFMSKDVAREKGYNTKESAVSGCIGTCKEG